MGLSFSNTNEMKGGERSVEECETYVNNCSWIKKTEDNVYYVDDEYLKYFPLLWTVDRYHDFVGKNQRCTIDTNDGRKYTQQSTNVKQAYFNNSKLNLLEKKNETEWKDIFGSHGSNTVRYKMNDEKFTMNFNFEQYNEDGDTYKCENRQNVYLKEFLENGKDCLKGEEYLVDMSKINNDTLGKIFGHEKRVSIFSDTIDSSKSLNDYFSGSDNVEFNIPFSYFNNKFVFIQIRTRDGGVSTIVRFYFKKDGRDVFTPFIELNKYDTNYANSVESFAAYINYKRNNFSQVLDYVLQQKEGKKRADKIRGYVDSDMWDLLDIISDEITKIVYDGIPSVSDRLGVKTSVAISFKTLGDMTLLFDAHALNANLFTVDILLYNFASLMKSSNVHLTLYSRYDGKTVKSNYIEVSPEVLLNRKIQEEVDRRINNEEIEDEIKEQVWDEYERFTIEKAAELKPLFLNVIKKDKELYDSYIEFEKKLVRLTDTTKRTIVSIFLRLLYKINGYIPFKMFDLDKKVISFLNPSHTSIIPDNEHFFFMYVYIILNIDSYIGNQKKYLFTKNALLVPFNYFNEYGIAQVVDFLDYKYSASFWSKKEFKIFTVDLLKQINFKAGLLGRRIKNSIRRRIENEVREELTRVEEPQQSQDSIDTLDDEEDVAMETGSELGESVDEDGGDESAMDEGKEEEDIPMAPAPVKSKEELQNEEYITNKINKFLEFAESEKFIEGIDVYMKQLDNMNEVFIKYITTYKDTYGDKITYNQSIEIEKGDYVSINQVKYAFYTELYFVLLFSNTLVLRNICREIKSSITDTYTLIDSYNDYTQYNPSFSVNILDPINDRTIPKDIERMNTEMNDNIETDFTTFRSHISNVINEYILPLQTTLRNITDVEVLREFPTFMYNNEFLTVNTLEFGLDKLMRFVKYIKGNYINTEKTSGEMVGGNRGSAIAAAAAAGGGEMRDDESDEEVFSEEENDEKPDEEYIIYDPEMLSDISGIRVKLIDLFTSIHKYSNEDISGLSFSTRDEYLVVLNDIEFFTFTYKLYTGEFEELYRNIFGTIETAKYYIELINTTYNELVDEPDISTAEEAAASASAIAEPVGIITPPRVDMLDVEDEKDDGYATEEEGSGAGAEEDEDVKMKNELFNDRYDRAPPSPPLRKGATTGFEWRDPKRDKFYGQTDMRKERQKDTIRRRRQRREAMLRTRRKIPVGGKRKNNKRTIKRRRNKNKKRSSKK